MHDYAALTHLAIFALGAVAHWLFVFVQRPMQRPVAGASRRKELPPATARRLRRAARANRLELRARTGRLWIASSDFDHEDTR